jgi:alpha-D-xyloside xylohydrolase
MHADWYNYRTNEGVHGGQTIMVNAPIHTLPLFVRAGSIVLLGEAIENTHQVQKIAKVRIYAGAAGDITLYRDDGTTYAYEKGDLSITHLHWDDVAHKLSHEGASASTGPDEEIIEVIGP